MYSIMDSMGVNFPRNARDLSLWDQDICFQELCLS